MVAELMAVVVVHSGQTTKRGFHQRVLVGALMHDCSTNTPCKTAFLQTFDQREYTQRQCVCFPVQALV